jgi:chorismate dehydratase
METFRIGKIPYLNLFPFFYYLEGLKEPSFEFIEAVPSQLNKLLRKGEIDVSPSSSIEYLLNQDLYEIIEGHSVSSIGPVRSIILFSSLSIGELKDKTVLATQESDTSVVQLKIIANIFLNLNIKIKRSNLPLEEGLKRYPAYLLIGDEAMKKAFTNRTYLVYDLGELWHRHTGLPFVYALWIVRKEVADKKSIMLRKLKDALDRIKKEFLEDPFRIAHLPWIGGLIGAQNVADYWKSLSFDLMEEHRRGLKLFMDYSKNLDEF